MMLEKYSKEFKELVREDQLDNDLKHRRVLDDDQLKTNRVSRVLGDDQLNTNRVSRRILRGTLIVAIIATLISVFSVLSQVFGWLD